MQQTTERKQRNPINLQFKTKKINPKISNNYHPSQTLIPNFEPIRKKKSRIDEFDLIFPTHSLQQQSKH